MRSAATAWPSRLLAIPAATTLLLKNHPHLYPFISFSYILAVTAAGWLSGFWAGVLVSCASIPVLTALVSGGKSIIPPSLDIAGLAVMVMISLLASRVAKARTQVEEALRIGNAKLEEASRLKSEFLAHMSHELRTPLNAVMGFTGTLLTRRPGPLTLQQEKYLKTVQSSARHLLSLINDLLDMAKIEAGQREIHMETVAIHEIVNELVVTLRPLLRLRVSGWMQVLLLPT